MSLRISSAALLALSLSACSSQEASEAGGTGGGLLGGNNEKSAAASVRCALAGAREYKSQCGLERTSVDGRVVVVLHHPDGGFRRLIELDGGKTYAAADGSDEAVTVANGAEIEVTLGDDHYLMPGPAAASAQRQ